MEAYSHAVLVEKFMLVVVVLPHFVIKLWYDGCQAFSLVLLCLLCRRVMSIQDCLKLPHPVGRLPTFLEICTWYSLFLFFLFLLSHNLLSDDSYGTTSLQYSVNEIRIQNRVCRSQEKSHLLYYIRINLTQYFIVNYYPFSHCYLDTKMLRTNWIDL